MKIGVISDIHDNIWTLQRALERLGDAEVILCCGDLCSPFIVPRLATGFGGDIHIVFGNNDGDHYRISSQAGRFSNIHLHGEFADLEFDGKRFGLTHFDEIARHLAAGATFDVVCFGHNHTFEVTRHGSTLLINPGEVMGGLSERQTATCVLYDTTTDVAQKIDLGPGNASESS